MENSEIPFYKFYVCDYFATGEGRSIWLMVDRYYGEGWSLPLDDFKSFIGDSFYHGGIEEFTEEKFISEYGSLIPASVNRMIEQKDQPGFNWKTHLYYNYS